MESELVTCASIFKQNNFYIMLST